jgi:hypothetical protein
LPPDAAEASSVQNTQQFARFAGWLPRHAGLVAGISLQTPSGEPQQRAAFCDTAEQLLVLAMREAAAHGRPTTTSAAAAAPLQLSSFKSRVMRSPELLQALPAAALTQLVLTYSNSWQTGLNFHTSGFAKQLARLTALRELQLSYPDVHYARVGDVCLAAIGQLTQLTKANLDASTGYDRTAKPCNFQLLPQQLQQLQLKAGSSAEHSVTLALDHLTALQQLQLTLWCDPAPDSALPAGLTALTVQQHTETLDVQHLAIHQLAQLQHLRAIGCLHQPEQLQQLSSLSKLTHIHLGYVRAWHALDAASTWNSLSALKSMSISSSMIELTLNREESTALLEHLAAASSLQNLEIDAPFFLEPAAYVCDYVTNLQQLQHLELIGVHPSTRAEALTLTKLTHLTALRLDGAAGVDDVVAVALAVRLTKLSSLCLYNCALRSAVALSAIAALTALTELHLCYSAPQLEAWRLPLLSAEELLLLVPLKQLRELRCHGFVHHFAMEHLWDQQNGSWREQW